MTGLNPLKRVNSILTEVAFAEARATVGSQSPQTGQFNSYSLRKRFPQIDFRCLNPLKRVNSILTSKEALSLDASKDKVSIPSNGSIQFLQKPS